MIGLSSCHVYTNLREVTCLTHVDTQGDAFLDLIKEHGRTVVPLKRWEKPTGQMLYTVLLLR